jgi:hypothetical protein
MFDMGPSKIIYCYHDYQPGLFGQIKKDCPNVEFMQGVPESFGEEGATEPSLYVLDDQMPILAKKPQILSAFIRGSHHRQISIICVVQNFYSKGLRDLTLQATHIIAFRPVRDTQWLLTLARQMSGGRKNQVMEDMLKSIDEIPYSYVCINLDQAAKFRYSTFLFPNDPNFTIFKSE